MFINPYDALLFKCKEQGINEIEMLRLLHGKGVTKQEIDLLRMGGLSCINNNTVEAVLDISKLTLLELELMMNHIPEEYVNSYLKNINKIAAILNRDRERSIVITNTLPIWSSKKGVLYNTDCLNILPTLENESVDLVFADPPFNLKKEYENGQSDNRSPSDYLKWSWKWINECIRVLKPGGSMYIYNIPRWSIHYADYISKQLVFQNWVAIDMKNGFPIKGKYTPSHYGLLYFTKGIKPRVFNRQRLPIQTCRHCGGELKDYGGYRDKMNKEGVNIADVWYDIFPVRKLKNRPYNELSIKLLERIISCSTNENDLILDPFGGSGTTYAAAEILNRRWIGIELGNCDYICERLTNPTNDIEKINNIKENKNSLFSKQAIKLRKKNGYWI